mmetsp:Transcript_2937/g.6160  ORF Transcript_2937/g.6160 Transcript_2937/m.6160 type:complete len:206 (-) Transcript_2937:292-909(-)
MPSTHPSPDQMSPTSNPPAHWQTIGGQPRLLLPKLVHPLAVVRSLEVAVMGTELVLRSLEVVVMGTELVPLLLKAPSLAVVRSLGVVVMGTELVPSLVTVGMPRSKLASSVMAVASLRALMIREATSEEGGKGLAQSPAKRSVSSSMAIASATMQTALAYILPMKVVPKTTEPTPVLHLLLGLVPQALARWCPPAWARWWEPWAQ